MKQLLVAASPKIELPGAPACELTAGQFYSVADGHAGFKLFHSDHFSPGPKGRMLPFIGGMRNKISSHG